MSIFGGRKQDEPPAARQEPKRSTPSLNTPSHHVTGFETVLGPSTTLYGDLKCQADIRLDGIFEGTLEIDGNVLVGETAKITADIHGKNVSIAGAVRGNVSGRKVQLLRTGRVWGENSATAITTEEGAFIDGKIKMLSHEAGQDYDLSVLPLPNEIEPDSSEPQEEAHEAR